MECNRDEALRAKELAERKFTEKDYVGAKKFALKAQNLSPTLDGISQMLTVLDVYIASEAKINGERDWYGVLHINTSADEETVKKQYRKLVLLLHPDKNKSAGSEGAFQFVSVAWNVLSNKSKKMVYDQKIFVKISHQKTFQTSNNDINTSAPSIKSNGFYQNTNMTAAKSRTQQNKGLFGSPVFRRRGGFLRTLPVLRRLVGEFRRQLRVIGAKAARGIYLAAWLSQESIYPAALSSRRT